MEAKKVNTDTTTKSSKHDDEPTTQEGLWYAIISMLCSINDGHTGKTNRLNGFTNSMKLGINTIKQLPVIRSLENITVGEIKNMIPTSMKSVLISDKNGNQTPLFAEKILYQASTNRNLKIAIEAAASLKHQQELTQLEAAAQGHYMDTPQGMGLSKEAYRAFGLELDDPIIVIEVNPSDYSKANFNPEEGQDIGEYRHGLKVKNYGLTEEDNKTSHLCINNETVRDIKIHVPAYYCGTKQGGCGKSFGSNQVRHFNGCPQCDKSKAMLSPQNVNITLPLVRNGKLVRSKVGQVEFRTLRLCKDTHNTLMKVKAGRAESWEGIEALMTNMQKMRYSSGKTTWVGAEIKPVVFDVIGHNVYLGLSVDYKKV
jgi:hypothetical protein